MKNLEKQSIIFDYEVFYDEAPVGYFTTNASGIIINANQFFLNLVQREAQETIGHLHLQYFLTIGSKMYLQTHYYPLLQLEGEVKEINLEILRKDKTKLPILINTNRAGKHEDSPIFHSVVFDIAQRNLFEKELIAEKKKAEQLTISLQQINEENRIQADTIQKQNKSLDRLNSVKDKFFSIIAHDIRGPLSQLNSFVALIKDHIDSLSKDDIKTMSHQIGESLSRTIDMAENLIEWAHSQMNGYAVTTSTFPIEEAVKQVIHSHLSMAHNKNIDLRYTIEGDPQVKADKDQLQFILRNILTNAIKFTLSGGVIQIHCQRTTASRIKIAVTDDGVGMSPETLETLFHDQMKLSAVGTQGERGNGIGLLLVKEFVEMNSGVIEVDSAQGEGTTFTVTLNCED